MVLSQMRSDLLDINIFGWALGMKQNFEGQVRVSIADFEGEEGPFGSIFARCLCLTVCIYPSNIGDCIMSGDLLALGVGRANYEVTRRLV